MSSNPARFGAILAANGAKQTPPSANGHRGASRTSRQGAARAADDRQPDRAERLARIRNHELQRAEIRAIPFIATARLTDIHTPATARPGRADERCTPLSVAPSDCLRAPVESWCAGFSCNVPACAACLHNIPAVSAAAADFHVGKLTLGGSTACPERCVVLKPRIRAASILAA